MPAKVIYVSADNLRSMSKIIESVTDKRSPSNASFSTKLTVKDGAVHLRAQSRLAVVDLVSTATTNGAQYDCWIGSEMLCAFSKQLQGDVEVRLRDRDIVLRGGPTYRLPHVEVDEPQHSTTDVLWSMTVDAQPLLSALKVAAAFTDGDDTRGLGGVGLELLEGGAAVRALGTEGSRLSWAQFPLSSSEGVRKDQGWMMQGELISPDAVRLLSSADWGAQPLTIEHRRGWLRFFDDETVIAVQLVSGMLPSAYRQVITHSSTPARLEVDSRDLLSLVQRASIGMGKRGSVKMAIEGAQLRCTGHNTETGADMHDEMQGTAVDGSTACHEAFFSPRLLTACLKPVAGQITIEMGKPLDPLIIRPEGPPGERLAVLMPVRER